jgi:hypothetical protein
MNELDLLVENYFTDSFKASDLFRLVEELMGEQNPEVLSQECATESPKEAGKRFEWVVVYQARQRANAAPLSDPEYACCPTWAQQSYPAKNPKSTLGDLADRSIDLALESGAITMEDLAQADMQTIGRQVPTGGKTKVEIKTDIVFGQKTISVKLSGDVQGQTNEAASTALQMSEVFTEVFKQWEEVEKEVTAHTLAQFKRDLNKIMAKMKRVGKQVRITPTRVKTLIGKDLKSRNKQVRDKALKRYQALLDSEIIDAQGKILIQALDQGVWEQNHAEYLTREINRLLDFDEDFRRTFTDEVLTGRRMFRDSPGAAAEYILSPEHFFVLAPGVEGYEDSIDIFSKAMTLGIRPKSGRTIIPGVNIGGKPAYRFDIKTKAMAAAIKYFNALKKSNKAALAAK